jgi:hypothetical protein
MTAPPSVKTPIRLDPSLRRLITVLIDKLNGETGCKPNIRKFLDLSTGHLDRSDRDHLDACAATGGAVGVAVARTEHGWFVYAADASDGVDDRNLPPHLRLISTYARAHGCDYILFDCDADIDPALPVFGAASMGRSVR